MPTLGDRLLASLSQADEERLRRTAEANRRSVQSVRVVRGQYIMDGRPVTLEEVAAAADSRSVEALLLAQFHASLGC